MAGWSFDLRQALRRLLRTPGFTAAAVATLGVAVAACSVVLAFGWATLVQPVARFPDRELLVDVQATRGRGADDRFGVAPADFVAWREAQTSFEAFGAYVPIGEIDLESGPGVGAGFEPLRLRSHLATADVFRALGVPPALGRAFGPETEPAGSDRVALLSDHLWRRLGGDPAVVGESLLLGGQPYRVVGVMPPGFGVRGGVPDLWIPLAFGPERPADRRTGTLVVVGRLRPDVGIERARAEMEAIGAALEAEFPDTNEDLRPSLEPLAALMTKGLRPTVLLLLGAVAAVLAVAAVNLGNLLLSRALAREREMSIRSSLGAGPGRLARQVLVEGAVLSCLAALVGMVLAAAALRALPDLQGRFLFQSIELRLGAPVLAGTAALALLAGALATVVPALRAAGTASWAARRPSAAATRDRRSARLGRALVVGQIAATLALLAGAGLLVRSLVERLRADLGYAAETVLSFEVSPPPSRYPGADDLVRLSDRLLAELEGLPGVAVAASSDDLPGAGWPVSVWPEPARDADAEPGRVTLHLVTPGYFEALGVPVLAGRAPGRDDVAGAPRVALLSRSAARLLFGDEAPVGRSVAVDDRADLRRVVGVVPDLRRDPSAEAGPAVYLAHAQDAALLDVVGQRRRLVVVRAAVHPASLASAAAAAVHRVDPQLPVSALQPLSTRVVDLSFRPRLATRLLVAFALLALALAAVGLYAILAEGISRRRREVGIRVALGAGQGDVVRLFAVPTAATVAAGIALGLLLAVALGRWMASLLFGVSPHDPLALASAAVVLGLAMALATVTPVRRSLSVDPRQALSEE